MRRISPATQPARSVARPPPQGMHHTVFRTVFGVLSVESPRHLSLFVSGPQRRRRSVPGDTPPTDHPGTAIPGNQMGRVSLLWPDQHAPQDVLPLDEPLHAVTIRNHVLTVAERLENALGEEQWSFIDSCPAEWAALPMPWPDHGGDRRRVCESG